MKFIHNSIKKHRDYKVMKNLLTEQQKLEDKIESIKEKKIFK